MEIEIPLLKDIVIIFALSAIVLLIGHRFRVPAIVGFLLTGIIAGPHALNFVHAPEVENLSRIGIILLLFTIGLEFSLKKLLEYKYYFLLGGFLQVGLTVVVGFCVAYFIGRPAGEAIFLGFLLSMSSTAIVLKVLETKDEADTPYGRITIGILIFQDIIAVPMMIVIPFLSDKQPFDLSFFYTFLEGCAIILVVFIASTKLIPKLLYYVARVRSRELFLISILTICSSIAWLASSAGLSLSLGAFLAGLLIAESEYSREALSNVVPLRDIFASFFFVSMGMLLDVNFVIQYPLLILVIALGVMLMKSLVVGFSTFVLGLPLRIIILVSIALSQVGEFSFVLAHSGMESGLASDFYYQLFLAVAILTMSLTPTLIAASHILVKKIKQITLPSFLEHGIFNTEFDERKPPTIKGHIIIVGFGLSGKNLAKGAREANIPYVVIEMNPETVAKEKEKGEPIFFGDASHEDVLNLANINEANAMAVVINDLHAARYIVELSHRLNPKLYLIVRTRYIHETKLMHQLGANDVISDEYGTSIEIFKFVLNKFGVSQEEIEKTASTMRSEEKKLQHNLNY